MNTIAAPAWVSSTSSSRTYRVGLDAQRVYATTLIDVFHLPGAGRGQDPGKRITLRPFLPADANNLQDFYERVRAEWQSQSIETGAFGHLDVDRVRGLIAEASDNTDARLMLVATEYDGALNERVIAHAVWLCADGKNAEFSLVVDAELRGQGLGLRLMQALMAGASLRRLQSLHASIRPAHVATMALMQRCGLDCSEAPNDEGFVKVRKPVPAITQCMAALRRPRRRDRAAVLRRFGLDAEAA